MSRAIILLLLSASILAGCVAQPPVDTTRQDTPEVVRSSTVELWLDQLQEVEVMDAAEVVARLAEIDKAAGANQLFYYGVLNQQVQNYGAWTVARDAFQKLQENEKLSKQQRQLAGVLRRFNQSRINGYLRYEALTNEQAQLREGLSQAEDEKRLLEQKIQALTALEAAISTRQEE